jgi:hypothetical protein
MRDSLRSVSAIINLNAASEQRMVFGPFLPGEFVESLRFAAASVNASAASAVGLQLRCRIAAFASQPALTAAVFSSGGRFLTGQDALISSPIIPLICTAAADGTNNLSGHGITLDYPLSWVADGYERWLGVELSSTDIAGVIVRGLVAVVMGRFSPPAPSSPGL